MKIFDVLLYVNSSFESFITDVAGVLLDPRDDGDDDDIFVFVGIDVSFLLFHWSDILFLHALTSGDNHVDRCRGKASLRLHFKSTNVILHQRR